MEIPFPNFKYTFADFFSGAGGFSCGAIQAGMKCISAFDYDVAACLTYWRNLCYSGWSHFYIDPDDELTKKKLSKLKATNTTNNWLFPYEEIPDNWLESIEPMPCLNLFCMDILKLSPEDWMKLCQVRPKDITLFIGGPPCQGVSMSNNSRSIFDERNQLMLRYIHYAKVCQPDMVLMENVPGLLSIGKSKKEKVSPFVTYISESFEDAGYDMRYEIHNAKDYGVPQNRKRVFFIAQRKGSTIQWKFPEPTHGPGKEPYVTVREAIMDLPPISAGTSYEGEPYSIKKCKGHVICSNCTRYVIETRTHCQICGHPTNDAIKGGIFKAPNHGITMYNTNESE